MIYLQNSNGVSRGLLAKMNSRFLGLMGKCELSYAAYKSGGMTEMKNMPSSFTHI